MRFWTFYIMTLGFAAYWASNLILWFPWSYNATLGMILMLSLTPLLWAYVTYLGLIRYPKTGIVKGSLKISFLFITIAVIMDYVFFGIIRNAMDALYHPTTFYGYGFLFALPFIIALLFDKKISKKSKPSTKNELKKAGFVGLFCLTSLIIILVFST